MAVVGLRGRLLASAVVPSLLVACALGFGMGRSGVMGTDAGAHAAAQAEATSVARALVRRRGATPRLPADIVGGLTQQIELLAPDGRVLQKQVALQPPPPGAINLSLQRLGSIFLPPATLVATSDVTDARVRVRAFLRPEPWQRAAGWGIALAAGAGAGAGLLAFLLAAALISTPIRRLRAIAHQAARLARGERTSPMRARGRGELALLEADLNRLGETLRSTRRRLDQEVTEATAALQTSLAELEAKNTELDLARRQALDASTAKTELLAMLSHELRTPLNAILGYARLIRSDPLTASQRESLDTVNQAARTLAQLLDGMLKLARVESGPVVIERQAFDLVALVDETITLFAPRAYGKRLQLIADCGGWRTLPVLGDPLRLQQILSNLLSNAVKYTPRGRVSVHLDVTPTGSQRLLARLSVRDTGPGVSAEDRPVIFDRFQRLEATAALPGSGLGLAISKKLVAAMNGHIELADAKDGGCEFHVSLPLARARQAERAEPISARVILWEADPVVRAALANRLCAAGVDVELARDRGSLHRRLERGDRFDAGVLGLAPGESVPSPTAPAQRLLVLPCCLPAAGPPGASVAPKCIGQQRFEQWLTSHGESRNEGAAPAARLSPRIWRLLCEETPLDLGRLGRALRDGQVAEARAAVHRIRGTAAMVRMRSTQQLAKGLESQLASRDPDLRAVWDQVTRLSRTLLTELRQLAPPATQRSLRDWRILVIDDNRLNGELLARHLQSHGASVKHCIDEPEVDNENGPWDAILIDVQLGRCDGIQLGTQLRKRFPEAMLIAQSADDQPLTKRRATAAGFIGYLTKPLDLDSLPLQLQTMRGSAGTAQEQRRA